MDKIGDRVLITRKGVLRCNKEGIIINIFKRINGKGRISIITSIKFNHDGLEGKYTVNEFRNLTLEFNNKMNEYLKD